MPLKVSACNVKTLLGENDGGEAQNWATPTQTRSIHSIEIAALSETRLSGEGYITEGSYTIFRPAQRIKLLYIFFETSILELA